MKIKVLAVINMYPYENYPYYGIFVKEQLEMLEEFGIEIDMLFLNGKKNKFNYLKGIFQILKRVRKEMTILLPGIKPESWPRRMNLLQSVRIIKQKILSQEKFL